MSFKGFLKEANQHILICDGQVRKPVALKQMTYNCLSSPRNGYPGGDGLWDKYNLMNYVIIT